MVAILEELEVFVGPVGLIQHLESADLEEVGIALVPQDFAVTAIRNVVEDGAPILVNLAL